MGQFDHPNVVQLKGVITKGKLENSQIIRTTSVIDFVLFKLLIEAKLRQISVIILPALIYNQGSHKYLTVLEF